MVVYYVIASNIGLAIMMLIVYIRYSKFRLSSAKEISELQKKVSQEVDQKKSIQERLLITTSSDGEKIEALLREIDELRKEKENEVKLRLDAQKQIDMAIQKTEEVEKRMHDWSMAQDAAMKDSKDAIIKVGNDLFKKLNDSYKNEIETNKNLLGRFSKNITDFMEKSVAAIAKSKEKKSSAIVSVKKDESAAKKSPATNSKLLPTLIKTMKANGWLAGKDYFTAENFDEQNAKIFFCDVAFVSLDKLYIIDFKASSYFEEYRFAKDEAVLKQKLDRYLDYLKNPKYLDSILKVMATADIKFEGKGIVIVIGSEDDVKTMKDLNYYDKARKIASEVLDINGVNNLVL
jgi:hypothetical protein